MSISDQIKRLNNAKSAIKNSIKNKGVNVSDTAKLDEYATLIDSIEAGSGESGDTITYEHPDFYELRTIGGTNYEGLFAYCSDYRLKTLDLSNWNTSEVTDMSYMFYFCSVLTSLDLSSFDTSNVTDMENMFYRCSSLASLDLSSFNTSNVTDMKYMFYYCNNLITIEGLSSFNTSNVEDMSYMFANCDKLTALDLSNFNTSNVTTMRYMFAYCSLLPTLDVSNFDTSNVKDMYNMFTNCDKLTALDLSSWDVSKVTNFNSMFYSCKSLIDFQAPKNIGSAIVFSSCTNLTHDSLMSIINNLTKVAKTTKLTLGATNLDKLTDEEKAIATNKGWTLA